MNWSGAKNWLIVLFVAINIFLILTITKSNMLSSSIDEETIAQTIDILNKNGIVVDKDIIPIKMPKLGSIDVQNSISNFDDFAKKLLGENVASLSGGHYASDSMRLSLKGDMVVYTDASPKDDIKDLKPSSAQRYALKWLSERGFETDMLSSYVYEKDNGYLVRIEQKFDKYKLLDSYLDIFVTQNGITEFSGSWFVPSNGQNTFSNDAAQVKSVLSTLLDFARDTSRIKNASNTITQIDLGYTTGEKSVYHKYATAIPVWRIRCQDGHEYFFDAR